MTESDHYRCMCISSGCRAGPNCPVYTDRCRQEINRWRANQTAVGMHASIKRQPTGFVAVCQCGVTVGAMDAKRTGHKEAGRLLGRLLGRWLSAGCTVAPQFEGAWLAHIEACKCTKDHP